MSTTPPLRLPQQPSKPIRLPASAGTAAKTTIVLPSLPQPSDPSSPFASSLLSRTCSVCCLHTARYTCPRCNVCSCSLGCYKQHSSRCTEQFASREEKQAMTGTLADDRTKRDTVAMLRRVQQQQDVHQLQAGGDQQEEEDEEGQGDSVDDEESARLLAAVGDDTLSLSSLSPEQQRLFLRAIHNGTLSRHIPVAVPWWVPARGREGNNTNGLERETREWEPQLENRLVEEVEREQSEEEQQSSAFVHSLPPLSSILRTEPSPAVPCQLLELVYGYCYVWRLYNCEPDADLPAFLADLVALSPSLAPTASSAPHHQSTTTTLQHCLAHVRSLPSLYQSPHFSALVLRDCSQLCLNSALLFRALREDRGVDAMRGVGEEAQAVWKDEVALCRERGEQR